MKFYILICLKLIQLNSKSFVLIIFTKDGLSFISTFYIKIMHEWKNSKTFLWRFQLIFISKNSFKYMQKCLFGRDCINKEWDHHHQLNLSDKTISWFWFENGYCMLHGYRKRKQEKMVKEDGIKWKKERATLLLNLSLDLWFCPVFTKAIFIFEFLTNSTIPNQYNPIRFKAKWNLFCQ